jgi:hypothetical protein
MVIQFVASYGHLHPKDFDFLTHGHGAPTLSSHHDTTRPIGDPMAADTDCPICSVAQLLGGSALPDDVRLAPPLAHEAVALASFDALWLTLPPHTLFDTRGPPLV